MAAVAIRTCESPGCQQPAKLQCPTCIKLGIQGSFFCAQDCFKQNWSEHRKVHKSAKAADDNNKPVTYNPWPGYRFTGKLKPWPQSPRREVPDHIQKPDYAENGFSNPQLSIEYSSWNRSVNEVICHGIPDTRPLEDGDLLNIDITIYYNGFHGDLNETFSLVKTEDSKQLVKVTHECLSQAIASEMKTNGSTLVSTMKQMATVMLAITVLIIILFCILVKPGVKYREIGNIIQKYAQAHGYAVVKSFCGHGIHSDKIPGTWQDEIWPDKWTAVTQDGKRSAQFEQTLLVTETGCDILTIRPDDNGRPHFLSQM
ncbi:LOW QUALITY PROTEIN: methionine aminopeptidase 1-like [Pocillopora damicornis]|uniref:LOW QUALITY PROTEIN: methionine aminopeptidase 1-like n=1 Tax=Pocillopora damicornis TaxID=46731 RepID=UPI000F54FE73|nr:LOW QUALITY PROTEIN: methionine aminopeptidase 1-like [Pocillopora damicornis]